MKNEELYKAASETWRHFASWREKIFAGYLTVLAGLGVALAGQAAPRLRVALYAGAVLVSAVFWLLDFRNAQILNACQGAAAGRESPEGAYSAMRRVRSRGSAARITFGLAVDVLVAGVVSCASTAIGVKVLEVAPHNLAGPLATSMLVMILTTAILQTIRHREWRDEHPAGEGAPVDRPSGERRGGEREDAADEGAEAHE